MAVKYLVIKPTSLLGINPNEVKKEIKKALQAESEQHRRMFKRATETWSAKNKPKFRRRTKESGDEISVSLTTKSKPFVYVEGGTRKRYMHMVPGYRPKSVPGSLKARQGGGKKAGLSWPIMPGIVARDFRKVIAKKRERVLLAKMNKVINSYVRKVTP